MLEKDISAPGWSMQKHEIALKDHFIQALSPDPKLRRIFNARTLKKKQLMCYLDGLCRNGQRPEEMREMQERIKGAEKYPRTEMKREKQNPGRTLNPEENYFNKGPSGRLEKDYLKLPTLERNSRNIFQSECDLKSQPKLVKVSIEKLRALKPAEVKKRFELKYRLRKEEDDQE